MAQRFLVNNGTTLTASDDNGYSVYTLSTGLPVTPAHNFVGNDVGVVICPAANSGGNLRIMRSTDSGVTWSYQDVGISSTDENGATISTNTVLYDSYNNRFIMWADRCQKAYYSTDGITWIAGSLYQGSALNYLSIYSAAINNVGHVVIIGQNHGTGFKVLYGDGISMTGITGPSITAGVSVITWDNGSYFVIATIKSSVIDSSSYYSSDSGATWTAGARLADGGTSSFILSDGNGALLVVPFNDSNGTGSYSTNHGVTWTSIGLGSANFFSGTYSAGYFILITAFAVFKAPSTPNPHGLFVGANLTSGSTSKVGTTYTYFVNKIVPTIKTTVVTRSVFSKIIHVIAIATTTVIASSAKKSVSITCLIATATTNAFSIISSTFRRTFSAITNTIGSFSQIHGYAHRIVAFPNLFYTFISGDKPPVNYETKPIYYSDDNGSSWAKGPDVYGCRISDPVGPTWQYYVETASDNASQMLAVVNRDTTTSRNRYITFSSDNGMSWTAMTATLPGINANAAIYSCAYDSNTGRFVLYDQPITHSWYSTNFMSWTQGPAITNTFGSAYNYTKAYGNGNVLLVNNSIGDTTLKVLHGNGTVMTQTNVASGTGNNFGNLTYVTGNTFKVTAYTGFDEDWWVTNDAGATWVRTSPYTAAIPNSIKSTVNVYDDSYSVIATGVPIRSKLDHWAMYHTAVATTIGVKKFFTKIVRSGTITPAGSLIKKVSTTFTTGIATTVGGFLRRLRFNRTFTAALFGFGSVVKHINKSIATITSTSVPTFTKIVNWFRPYYLDVTSNDNTVFGNLWVGNSGAAGNALVSFSSNTLHVIASPSQLTSALSQVTYTSPAGLDEDWIATYSLYDNNNTITSIRTQHNKSSSNQYMSYATPTIYTKNVDTLLINTPQITETISNADLTTFTVNVSSTTSSISNLVASVDVYVGGTSSYGSGTLTLTGSKAQVNNLLGNITYTPVTNYNSEFDFVYKYTSPGGTLHSTRHQHVYPTHTGSVMDTNIALTRTYVLNGTDQAIFANNTPQITETSTSDLYTMILTTEAGKFGLSAGVSTSVYTWTGNKSAFNTQMQSILFYSFTDYFGNQTATFQLYKNNVLQFTQTFALIGV